MKHKTFLLVLLLSAAISGCIKDNTAEEILEYVEVGCSIDMPGEFQEGLRVLSSWGSSELSPTAPSILRVAKSTLPQVIAVLDSNDNIRMLYKGIVDENGNISIDVNSTALAMASCNPVVASLGDSNFAQTISLIKNLSSYAEFRTLLESQLSSGAVVFDTNNTLLLQSLQAVFDELLGVPDTDTIMPSKNADPWHCVSHYPLKCEYVSGNDPTIVYLSNYSLCPTYWGTLKTDGFPPQELIIRTKGSFSVTGAAIDLLSGNELAYGDKEYVGLPRGLDSRIELTNLHCAKAKLEIGTLFVRDLLNAAPIALPNNTITRISTLAGEFIAASIANYNNTNEPFDPYRAMTVAKAIGKDCASMATTEILNAFANGAVNDYATEASKEMFKKVVNKVFVYYNFIVGTGNTFYRLACLLGCPNDISFCLHTGYNTQSQNYYVEPCGWIHNYQYESIHYFPYRQDFENGLGWWEYGCDWSSSNGYIPNGNNAHSGNGMVKLTAFQNDFNNTYNSHGASWIESPSINLGGHNAKLSFWHRGDGGDLIVVFYPNGNYEGSPRTVWIRPRPYWEQSIMPIPRNTNNIAFCCQYPENEIGLYSAYVDDISIALTNMGMDVNL